MHFPTHYFVLLPLAATISLLTTSCTESKISQCNKINKIANQVVSQVKVISTSSQANDPKVTIQVAEVMEKASKEMAASQVNDPQLKDYQTSFIKMYRDSSKAARDFVGAFEKKNRPAAETALSNLQQASNLDRKLVTDINSYCSGN